MVAACSAGYVHTTQDIINGYRCSCTAVTLVQTVVSILMTVILSLC